jgi:trehalose 6-phosphate phosphatase
MYRLEMEDIAATGTARLDALVAHPDAWALFIDIDGTLLDMAPTPDAVEVPPGLVDTLARLADSFNGAVALVTGRRLADVDRFFAPLKLPVSGVHGTEARAGRDGGASALADPVPAGLAAAVRSVARALPGTLVEDKGPALAVHFRSAPDSRAAIERELRRVVGHWGGYALRNGRQVLEVVPKGHSKATGLAWLMQLPAFAGRRPVMIGDDHGDEPALEAAERLGGIGLRVAGEHFGADAADFRSPAGVRAWLAGLGSP